MRHGSLFSGIGGFDLAAEWMGWQNVFHCEWMPFPRKVLSHYWPEAISYHDITATDFREHEGSIDILTGGFPCQPYSSAGKRLGKEDERHLWPHMLRAIREISPRWVVGENVRGLTNWNGGVVFDEVQADLESEGYEVLPFLLPAAAVNAPHRRDRIWFVAHRDLHGLQQCNSDNEEYSSQGRQYAQRNTQQSYDDGDVTNPMCTRLQIGQIKTSKPDANHVVANRSSSPHFWANWPTQSPICGGDDGLPTQLDGITFPKWRAESIKGYGNAIVPQVALQIFKAIKQYERGHHAAHVPNIPHSKE